MQLSNIPQSFSDWVEPRLSLASILPGSPLLNPEGGLINRWGFDVYIGSPVEFQSMSPRMEYPNKSQLIPGDVSSPAACASSYRAYDIWYHDVQTSLKSHVNVRSNGIIDMTEYQYTLCMYVDLQITTLIVDGVVVHRLDGFVSATALVDIRNKLEGPGAPNFWNPDFPVNRPAAIAFSAVPMYNGVLVANFQQSIAAGVATVNENGDVTLVETLIAGLNGVVL